MIKLTDLLPTLLTENERHRKLEFGEAREILVNQCRTAIDKFNEGFQLRRFENYIFDSVYRVNPRDSQRTSHGTDNYYNLLIDSSPAWKGFPSRSWSIIFADYQVANDYAQGRACHYVFPIGNPIIAVSKEQDFWSSMMKDGDFATPVFSLNNLINRLLNKYHILHDRSEKDVHKFQVVFKKLCDCIDQDISNNIIQKEVDVNKLYEYIKSMNKPAYEVIYNLFTPQNTNTTLTTLGDMKSLRTECWTEGDCIVLQTSALRDIFGQGWNADEKRITI
jgi:hypothetical protein